MLAGASSKRLVRAEHERDGVIEHERALLEQRRDRRVRGQTQRDVGQHVADVVAAVREGGARGPVVAERPQLVCARCGRPASGTIIRTSIIGRKKRRCCWNRGAKSMILTAPPFAVAQHRLDDGRVRQVTLLAAREAGELDVVKAARRARPSPASSEQNVGSPSNRGTQAHTIRARRSSSAAIWQLPINARSRSLMAALRHGPAGSRANRSTCRFIGAAANARKRCARAPTAIEWPAESDSRPRSRLRR